MSNKDRLCYLDNARGFALLGVIIGHIYPSNNAFITWIYSFHVPLFFIISGALLYYKNSINNSFLSILISRVKSILIPYLMFCLVNIVFEIFLNPSIETLRWTLIQTVTLFGIGATWFLPALFISEIIFISIHKYLSSKFTKITLVSLLFIIPFILTSNHIILTVLFRSLTALGYISIGFYIFQYINKLNISWFTIISILVISILLSSINGNVDLYSLHYNNPIIYLICSVIGSVLILLTLKKLSSISFKLLTYLGLNSIIIMATHQSIIRVCQIILKNDFKNFLGGTLLLITILIIEIPLVYVITNYLPWMLGKLSIKTKLSTTIG